MKNLSIGEALFGKTQRAVLALLFGHPERAYYLREVLAASGTGASQVQKELENLTRAGLIIREPRGKQVWFRANPESPVFPELKSLAAKTFGIADALREALHPFEKKIRTAFIFGSVARGEHHASSDVDVLVVGDITPSQLAPAQLAVGERLGRKVSIVVMGEAQLNSARERAEKFIDSVFDGPRIDLIDNRLEKPAAHANRTRKSGRQKSA
jgi:predicted nucleotidyltransferase